MRPGLGKRKELMNDSEGEDDFHSKESAAEADLNGHSNGRSRGKSRSQIMSETMTVNAKARADLVEARVKKMAMDGARQDREQQDAAAERKVQRERDAARDYQEMEMHKHKVQADIEYRAKEMALREREIEMRGREVESQRTQTRLLSFLLEQRSADVTRSSDKT